ncbi:MAG: protein-disulfide reductase DsbD [Proteobacteria bacterium]|nr:protein-disulfide reductase DsbD [Pseudomonadota bacterium]
MMPNKNAKHNLVIYLIIFLCMLITYRAQASALSSLGIPKVLPLESAFSFELTQEDEVLVANWQIAPKCYLYQQSIKFSLRTPQGEMKTLPIESFPKAVTVDDAYFGKQAIYQHSLMLTLPQATILKELDNTTLLLTVEFQGCAESGFCYPPTNKTYELTIKDHQITSLLNARSPEPLNTLETKSKKPEENSVSKLATPPQTALGFLSSIGTFYLFGLLLTFTPCVWPMIPILAGVIVGQTHLSTRKAFRLSLCYVLSMAISYAIAGIIAATLGKNLQASLQHPGIIISFSILFSVLALMQLGILRITMPPHFRLKDILHALHAKQESGTYIGAAIMGMLATLISSPCVTPALIFALGYISHSGNILLGGSALLAMGFGMGTILLIIGTLGGKFLPRSGPWMHHVNQVFAIIMFGLSIWLMARIYHHAWILLLWGLLCLFIAWCMNTFKKSAGISARVGMVFVLLGLMLFWGAYQGYKDPLQVLSHLVGKEQPSATAELFSTVTTQAELDTALSNAHREKRPSIVVFYADWCVACQHLEHEVFGSETVAQQLKNFSLIRVDVTTYNKQAEQLLSKFDLIGPPAVLFFSQDSKELTNFRIFGGASENQFSTVLEQVKKELSKP